MTTEKSKTTQSREKIMIRFNEGTFNSEHSRILSVAPKMQELASLLTAAGIESVNVSDLLSNPYREMINYVSEDIRRFVANLQSAKLYNWAGQPAINAIINWAELYAGNTDVNGYWIAFDLSTGEVKEEYMNALRERHTLYCRSEKQVKVLEKVQAAAKLLNEAQSIASVPWLGMYDSELTLGKPFLREGREYVVNAEFIETL